MNTVSNLGLLITEYFLLRNKSTRKCLDVKGYPGTADRANIQSFDCEYGQPISDQIWSMDQYGRLISRASRKCLDVKGYRNAADRTNLQLFRCENPSWSETDHLWDFESHPGTRYFRIRNRHTRKCVDVKGWSETANSVNIQQFRCEAFEYPATDHWWEKVIVDY